MDSKEIGRLISESATDLAKEIVRRWNQIGESEEWLSLPPDLGHDHLPWLIKALSECVLVSEFEIDQCGELAAAAVKHGSDRAEQGFGEALIFREYHLLRRTLRTRMRELFGENSETFYAIMRIDSGISLASTASLLGVHRAQIEAQGRWPDALDKALADWRGDRT